jgi:hypothetical protein
VSGAISSGPLRAGQVPVTMPARVLEQNVAAVQVALERSLRKQCLEMALDWSF